MTPIPFTQFLRPNGRKEPVTIDRPDDIAALAQAIIAKGYWFECESLLSGQVSFTITDDRGDHAIAVVRNGPDVEAIIDRMIVDFAKKMRIEP